MPFSARSVAGMRSVGLGVEALLAGNAVVDGYEVRNVAGGPGGALDADVHLARGWGGGRGGRVRGEGWAWQGGDEGQG